MARYRQLGRIHARRRRIRWPLLMCVIFPVFGSLSVAQDTGPFGLRAGMTRKQVEQIIGPKALIQERGDDVTYSTVPESHPDFDQYTLTFSRTYGLVEIQALSRDLDDDSALKRLSSKCSEIRDALKSKYGVPDKKPQSECRLSHDEVTLFSWTIDPPRRDKVRLITLSVLPMRLRTNPRGERVLAGSSDTRARASK